MIEPNTLCMIRGVPKTQLGYDCNGKIVLAVAKVFDDVYRISPALESHKDNKMFNLHGSRECYLHPLRGLDEPMTTKTPELATI